MKILLKPSLIALIILITVISANSQVFQPLDLNNKMLSGIIIGTDYSLLQNNEMLPDSISLHNNVGYFVGGLVEKRLFKLFFISPKIYLSINEAGFRIKNSSTGHIEKKYFMPITIDYGVDFILKILNESNYHPHISAGIKTKRPLVGKAERELDLIPKPSYNVDIGIGISKKIKYFIISPEIKYSFGLNDVNSNGSIKGSITYNSIAFALILKG